MARKISIGSYEPYSRLHSLGGQHLCISMVSDDPNIAVQRTLYDPSVKPSLYQPPLSVPHIEPLLIRPPSGAAFLLHVVPRER